MTEQFKNEKEKYFHKSRQHRLFYYHVEEEPDKPWDYEYLFQNKIYPAKGKPKIAIQKWIDIFPPEKLDFDALSQHHHIDDSWIYQFPLGNWNLKKLSENRQFNFEMAFHCPEFINRNWDWTEIIFSKNEVSLETYLHILQRKWNIKNYKKCHIRKDWLQHIPETPEIYHYLSQNQYLDTDWLLTKPKAPWDVEILYTKINGRKSDWYLIVKSDKWPFTKMTIDHGVRLNTLKMYPKAPWNFPLLSKSCYITLEWLQAFPKANWDFHEISNNYHLELYWLQTFPDADWDFLTLSQSKRLSIEWVEAFPNAPWNFNEIANTLYLEYNWVELFPVIPWDFPQISSRILDPTKWLTHFPDAPWDYQSLLGHKDMTLDLLKLIPHSKIDFNLLSESSNLTLEWIDYYPQESWNFVKLSMSPNITLDWIGKYPEANWSFQATDWNQNKSRKNKYEEDFSHDHKFSKRYMTHYNYHLCDFYSTKFELSWLVKFPNLKWDYSHICDCKNLSLEFLQKYSDMPWDFRELSYKIYITLDYLDSFPNADWDFTWLSHNPNLKLTWIKKYPDARWNFSSITKHSNFSLSWFESFPKANWHVGELFLKNRRNYTLVLYQFHHPDISVIAKIPDTKNQRESMHLNLLIPLMLLNPKNRHFFPEESKKLGFWETQELNEAESWNVVRLAQSKYNFANFYPEIIYHIDEPIELQDLSGDYFPLTEWFESQDIMGLAHATYPQLGNFDILIDLEDKEEDFMASRHTNQALKNILVSLVKGPFGMVVYPDELTKSAIMLPSQEEEDEFEYFEMW